MRVKCLAQEHNTMTPARAQTWTTRSGDECAMRQPHPNTFLEVTHLSDVQNCTTDFSLCPTLMTKQTFSSFKNQTTQQSFQPEIHLN